MELALKVNDVAVWVALVVLGLWVSTVLYAILER